VKKTFVVVGAVAALGVAWAGSTALIGAQVEKKLAAQADALTQQFPALKVTEQRYEKGFFSATRTTTLQLGCQPPAGAPGAPAKPVTLTVRDRILHGPVPGGRALGIALIESELVLPEELQQKVTKLFGDRQPLQVRTVVGLLGGFDTEITSPAFELELEGEQLSWKGLQGTMNANASATLVRYDVRIPGLDLAAPAKHARLALAGVRLHGEHRPVNGSMWIAAGKGEGELASLELRFPLPATDGGGAGEPWSMSLRDLRFTSDSSVEDELLGSRTKMTGAGTMGEAKLENIELEASLRRMHVPSYQKLMSLFMGASCDVPGRAQDPQQLLGAAQKDLVQLLVRSPEYGIDRLALDVDGKRGELSYSLGVDGVTDADLDTPAMALLSTRMAVKADARLPVIWLEQLAGFLAARSKKGEMPPPEAVNGVLDGLAAQGFVLRDGEYVKSSVRLAKGMLQVNGKVVPLGR
jgi:uncharacterized protein YdgA (DUF945 family)